VLTAWTTGWWGIAMLLGNCYFCGKPVSIMDGDFPKGRKTPVHTKCSDTARRPRSAYIHHRDWDDDDPLGVFGLTEYDIDPDLGDR
jgi:hypothetical protein